MRRIKLYKANSQQVLSPAQSFLKKHGKTMLFATVGIMLLTAVAVGVSYGVNSMQFNSNSNTTVPNPNPEPTPPPSEQPKPEQPQDNLPEAEKPTLRFASVQTSIRERYIRKVRVESQVINQYQNDPTKLNAYLEKILVDLEQIPFLLQEANSNNIALTTLFYWLNYNNQAGYENVDVSYVSNSANYQAGTFMVAIKPKAGFVWAGTTDDTSTIIRTVDIWFFYQTDEKLFLPNSPFETV